MPNELHLPCATSPANGLTVGVDKESQVTLNCSFSMLAGQPFRLQRKFTLGDAVSEGLLQRLKSPAQHQAASLFLCWTNQESYPELNYSLDESGFRLHLPSPDEDETDVAATLAFDRKALLRLIGFLQLRHRRAGPGAGTSACFGL